MDSSSVIFDDDISEAFFPEPIVVSKIEATSISVPILQSSYMRHRNRKLGLKLLRKLLPKRL